MKDLKRLLKDIENKEKVKEIVNILSLLSSIAREYEIKYGDKRLSRIRNL